MHYLMWIFYLFHKNTQTVSIGKQLAQCKVSVLLFQILGVKSWGDRRNVRLD